MRGDKTRELRGYRRCSGCKGLFALAAVKAQVIAPGLVTYHCDDCWWELGDYARERGASRRAILRERFLPHKSDAPS